MDLNKLKELCEKATPGPWEWMSKSGDPNYPSILQSSCENSFHKGLGHSLEECGYPILISDLPDELIEDEDRTDGRPSIGDAEFIAAARTVLPLLIKIVEAAKEDTQYMKTSPLDGAYIAGASAGNLCNSITWRKTLNALAEFEKG